MTADELEYLTVQQVAERLGIKPKSVRQSLWRGLMPEPDMILFDHPLWLTDTIDNWRKRKGKWRKKSRRVTRPNRVRPAPVSTLPKRARLSTEGSSPEPLAQASLAADIAARIAADLRSEGHHATTRDVQELAQADPSGLDYDRRKLQQRVARKLRGLKGT